MMKVNKGLKWGRISCKFEWLIISHRLAEKRFKVARIISVSGDREGLSRRSGCSCAIRFLFKEWSGGAYQYELISCWDYLLAIRAT